MTMTSSTETTTVLRPHVKKRALTEIVGAMLCALDDAGGEVTGAVDELGLELEDKVQAYRAVMLQLEAEQAAFKALAEQYEAREKAREQQVTGLKFRLDEALRAMGVDKLRTPTCTVYYQRSTRVEIADEPAFLESAEDRFVQVKSYADKTAIKKALEAGEQVEGAALAESRHLRFR